jgi:hypothetical protein
MPKMPMDRAVKAKELEAEEEKAAAAAVLVEAAKTLTSPIHDAASASMWDGPPDPVKPRTKEETLHLQSETEQLGSPLVRESQAAAVVTPSALSMDLGVHAFDLLELSPVLNREDSGLVSDLEPLLLSELASSFGPLPPREPRKTTQDQEQDFGTGPRPITTSPPQESSGLSDSLAITSAFLNKLASPIPPPLYTPPAAGQQASATGKNPTRLPKGDTILRSSRLAAKPSAGLTTMDKVKLVLLKKNGIEAEDASHKDTLKKYNNIYKHQLPPEYIKAVVSLVDTTKTGKKGGSTVVQEVVVAI